ncbi:hypothetical protein KIN20_032500 [Parelaphostrongylus tenuis]|uniref:glycerophosphocholine cholinephosphodiesterase n=1 Tax=Parelaphostrongylus tenuis TaxID=148309 RepID=A0AAD5R766_PARTN|nr:hypothetical protein KIN20_032500 [Parelaphostrongylus tenuis]
MFFFPECKVVWAPPPHLCLPPRDDNLSFADERIAKVVVEATRFHDLVLVHHPNIRQQIASIGPRNVNSITATEVEKFYQALERLTSQARERIDLNVIVVSTHGLVDVPRRNIRVLDDYLSMELLQTSIVYLQLRNHTPIPNVKVYYTTPKIGDMPEWYHYRKSATVPDLVLVAQPGYAILTRDPSKQISQQQPPEVQAGMSGYNNHYPELLGVFLAYGPEEDEIVMRAMKRKDYRMSESPISTQVEKDRT